MNEKLELYKHIYKDAEMAIFTLTKLLEELREKDNKIKKTVEEILKGYERYFGEVKDGEQITLILDDKPKFVYASPKIPDIQGCVTIQRGPLVYCFEGADNEGDILSLAIDDDAAIEVEGFEPKLLSGVARLKVQAYRQEIPTGLYTTKKLKETACEAYAT